MENLPPNNEELNINKTLRGLANNENLTTNNTRGKIESVSETF
jgi:hypothetical protein